MFADFIPAHSKRIVPVLDFSGTGTSTGLRRPYKNGGYLLSHKRSTIGVVGLNFSVRNGKRWNPDAIAT